MNPDRHPNLPWGKMVREWVLLVVIGGVVYVLMKSFPMIVLMAWTTW